MLHLSSSCKYYLYREPCDMRKGFDSLSGIVQSQLKHNALSGDVFIFISRRRNQIKLLLWEGDGFALYHKRLERGTFELPPFSGSDQNICITSEQLLLILKGISLRHVHKRKRYEHGSKIHR